MTGHDKGSGRAKTLIEAYILLLKTDTKESGMVKMHHKPIP